MAGIKTHIIQLSKGTSIEVSPKHPPRTVAKSPLLTRYLHLIQYPLPPPKDTLLAGVIGTSLVQALTALTTLVCPSSENEILLDKFASTIEADNGLLMWHSYLPRENADALLARAHRVLAVTLSSDYPPGILFRLRTWALRCLLLKGTLDPDSFWSQATSYLASHGKSVIKTGGCCLFLVYDKSSPVTGDGAQAVTDAVRFFDVLVVMAQGRQDAKTFTAGLSFMKFCEIVLVFAQRVSRPFSLNIYLCLLNVHTVQRAMTWKLFNASFD